MTTSAAESFCALWKKSHNNNAVVPAQEIKMRKGKRKAQSLVIAEQLTLIQLPEEIWGVIFRMLPVESFVALCRTCRALYHGAYNMPKHWDLLCQDYGYLDDIHPRATAKGKRNQFIKAYLYDIPYNHRYVNIRNDARRIQMAFIPDMQQIVEAANKALLTWNRNAHHFNCRQFNQYWELLKRRITEMDEQLLLYRDKRGNLAVTLQNYEDAKKAYLPKTSRRMQGSSKTKKYNNPYQIVCADPTDMIDMQAQGRSFVDPYVGNELTNQEIWEILQAVNALSDPPATVGDRDAGLRQ